MVGDIFRSNGNRVIAIEPNAEMRQACAALHAGDALFSTVDGTAEDTGLADASVEMIAVGRALHWFHVEKALAEFRQVLKPGGWVAILACGRAEAGRAENAAYVELMRTSAGRDIATEDCLRIYQQLPGLFQGGEFHHAEVLGEMELDWEGLLGLTLSLSHAPMPGTEAYPAFEADLREYFGHYEQNGKIRLATQTFINAGRFGS